ncbi:MAG: Rubrerythrin [bacterium ADurb.Bin212]|nr:MAG: Rubrerythrin [bacterium ADurb.Bin212]
METEKNILRAIAGESMARNKYTYFASQAKKEGFEQIAFIFEDTANNEKEHAKRLMKLLKDTAVSSLVEFDFPVVKSTHENLLAAAEGENHEHSKMYPDFAKTAKAEGMHEAATIFTEIGEVEEEHEKRYLKLAENIKSGKVFKRDEEVKWRCRNCGYVHKGTEAPQICPACAHPQAHYELLCENY